MAMNSEYRGSAYNSASMKKPAAKKKTVVTPGTKVSQATLDKIKAMGMTKALKGAANASPEMREGLKRLYGAKRVASAAPSKPVARSADSARSAATAGPRFKSADSARSGVKPSKPAAKSADAARSSMTKPSVVKTTTGRPARVPATGAAKVVVNILSGRGIKANNGMNAAQVAAENKRRAKAAKNK